MDFIYMSDPGYDMDEPYGPSVPLYLEESDYKSVIYLKDRTVAICEDAYGYDVLYTDREPRCFWISGFTPDQGELDMDKTMSLDAMIRELVPGINEDDVTVFLEWCKPSGSKERRVKDSADIPTMP